MVDCVQHVFRQSFVYVDILEALEILGYKFIGLKLEYIVVLDSYTIFNFYSFSFYIYIHSFGRRFY